jgi:hypothetical protein
LRAAAEFGEADQVQGEILDPVEQAVEPGVIADCGDDARAAAAGLDRGVVKQGCQQWSALAAQDDPVPAAGTAGHGLDRASLSPDGPGLLCLFVHGVAVLRTEVRA